MLRPEFDRTCGDCRKYWIDEHGVPAVRFGKVLPRPAGSNPPCHVCPKIPAGVLAAKGEEGVSWADAVEPEPRHRQAVRHFLECDAVGVFPDDGHVRKAAAVCRPVKDRADRIALAQCIVAALPRKKG